MVSEKKIRVKLIGKDSHSAYIALPGYPEPILGGVVSKTICLDEVLDNFKGPRINLDFNNDGVLIGIEILA